MSGVIEEIDFFTTKARKGPTENRAASWPCGQKIFSVLIFCYFFIKKKVVAPRQ